jgi:hypothetical protein
MKRSFFLGILGGIVSFAIGMLAFFLMVIDQASGGNTDLTVNIVLAFIAGTLGIVGGVVGNKRGGIILVISGGLALIATSLFGVLPCVLLLVGGGLAFRERGEIEPSGTHEVSEKEKHGFIYYITILAACATIATLVLTEANFYLGFYMQPRAKLTVSISSYKWTSSDTTSSSIGIPVTISNYSPRTANILPDWNLTLVFNNSTFQIPNANCTFGTTKLDPAQQTEFYYSYDITNNTSFDMNELKSVYFTISYIDDQGTQTEGLEFIR